MKVSVNDKQIFILSEIQKKVIKNDVNEDIFDEDMNRRLKYILEHKYERCLERLRKSWDPILKERYKSIPTNDDDYCALIFEQPDYKCKKTREDKEITITEIQKQ